MFLFAEILDDFRRAGARLAEADPAVLPESELLAPQEQFGVPLDRDKSAVAAVVLQHELALASLDGAVLPRGVLVGDRQAAIGLAPDSDRFAAPPPHDLDVSILQSQRRVRRSRDGAGPRDCRHVRRLTPDELAQHDLFALALDLDRVQAPGPVPKHRTQQPRRLLGDDDLSLRCLLDEACGQIDRVAEHVVVALDDGAGVKADAHRELGVTHRRERLDRRVHLRRGTRRRVRRRKESHDLVAERLYHATAVRFRRPAQLVDALPDRLERRCVSRSLVELRAAAYVGKKNGRLPAWFHLTATLSNNWLYGNKGLGYRRLCKVVRMT